MNYPVTRINFFKAIMLIAAISFFAACKKDADHTTTNGDKRPVSITQVESFATYNFTLTYNPDSTVKTINVAGGPDYDQLVFAYKPNIILIEKTRLAGSIYNESDSISLNQAGRMTNIYQYNADRTNWQYNRYDFNSNNEITLQTRGVSTSEKTSKWPYTYLNGNMLVASYGTFAYDLAKPAQVGDYHSIRNLLDYGLRYNLSKNLVKGQVFGTDTTFYKYNYDSKNRIIECDLVQGGKTLTQYKLGYND